MAITSPGTPQSTGSGVSSTTRAVTLTGCQVDDGIWAAQWWEDGTQTYTLSSVAVDSESNATLHGSVVRSGEGTYHTAIQGASLAACAASGDKAVTSTFSSSCIAAMVAERVQGHDTAAFFIAEGYSAAANETDDGNISFDVPTTNDNEMVVIIFTYPGGTAPTLSGITGLTQITVPDLNIPNQLWRVLDAGAAGTKTITAVFTVFGHWEAKALRFKAAAGGGSGGGPLTRGLTASPLINGRCIA